MTRVHQSWVVLSKRSDDIVSSHKTRAAAEAEAEKKGPGYYPGELYREGGNLLVEDLDDAPAKKNPRKRAARKNVSRETKRPNPRSLTLLGKLTRLETKQRTYSWPLRSAPLLAYDAAGKLFIGYRGKVVGASSDAQRKEYKRTHWGLDGDGDRIACDFAPPPYTIGEVSTRIAYTTEKGTDRELTDYVHEWGDYGGRKKPFTAPRVARHTCSGHGRCGSQDAIVLLGGSYTVKPDGIVG